MINKVGNVLDLFGGMSCGQIALNRAGISYDNYFTSEIDKYAIKVTMANYPNTIQLGSVTDVKASDLPKIDLLIGGSPCQGFSFAGNQMNFDDPRSALFFEYVRLLKECKPKYFLLENVKMKKEYQDVISKHLGVEPIEINSALVSAQNRKRLYWCNWHVEQPEDKGIFLKDIIDYTFDGEEKLLREKSKTIRVGGLGSPPFSKQEWDGVYKNNSVGVIKNHGKYELRNDKQRTLIQVGSLYKNNGDAGRIYSIEGKARTLKGEAGGGGAKMGLIGTGSMNYRKLTPLECERLQTVPDNYTNHVSNTQRYKMLGNGWTVDVIVHIFSSMRTKKHQKCYQLSLFD